MKIFNLLITCLFALSLNAQTLVTRNVATGFDTPWEILWGPDNHIWMTERIGKINRVNPETGQVQNLITIAEVFEGVERGLMGLALHPDFPTTPKVYAAYTYGSGATTVRVVVYDYDGSTLKNPKIIIDNITGNSTHDGCRLYVYDNKLWLTTGDAQQQDRPQNKNSTNGKILRLNLDGTIPTDNPVAGNPMYSFGHRNPQGFVVANGKIYSSEHGPSNDDEVNLITRDSNYGWPNVEGFCNTAQEITFCQQNNVKEPMRAWTPTLAVAGIDYYDNALIPQFRNSLLMVSLKAGRLTQLKLNTAGDAITEEKTIYNNTFGRLRDICISPDGRIFIATSNKDGRGTPAASDDRIIEIKPDGSGISSIALDATVISPNPVDSGKMLQIDFPVAGEYRIRMYDLRGSVVMQKEFPRTTRATIQVNGLQPGAYLLQIAGRSATIVKKVIIQ
jgi:glucose/arabinose dehydrogenase